MLFLFYLLFVACPREVNDVGKPTEKTSEKGLGHVLGFNFNVKLQMFLIFWLTWFYLGLYMVLGF